jgi:ankyrin repeat protein
MGTNTKIVAHFPRHPQPPERVPALTDTTYTHTPSLKTLLATPRKEVPTTPHSSIFNAIFNQALSHAFKKLLNPIVTLLTPLSSSNNKTNEKENEEEEEEEEGELNKNSSTSSSSDSSDSSTSSSSDSSTSSNSGSSTSSSSGSSTSDSDSSDDSIPQDLEDSETPLHLAAKKGNDAIVELLFNRNANLHAQNKDLQTPLHLAAHDNEGQREGDLYSVSFNKRAIIKLILSTLTNDDGINAKDIHGYPTLYYAITSRFRSDKSVKLLLKHRANTDFCDKNGDNLILLAAQKANWDALKVLIKYQKNAQQEININAYNSEGRTALYYTILHRIHSKTLIGGMFCRIIISLAAVELLLEHGADANFCILGGDTPILLAAQQSYWEAVKLLVDKSANINAEDSKGKTALHYAASKGQKDVIPFLIQNGANFTLQDKKGRTPMQIAIKKQDFKTALLIYEKYIELPSNQRKVDNDRTSAEIQQFITTLEVMLETILEDHPISVMLKTLYSYKPKNIKSAATNRPNNPYHLDQVGSGENEESREEPEVELSGDSSID